MQTMRKRKALIFAATTILVSPVYAETCPDPIAEASRLVLVTTRSMDTQLATMQLFTRQSANKPWKRISAAEPAVVGKAGLGWGYSVLASSASLLAPLFRLRAPVIRRFRHEPYTARPQIPSKA
jgi:hypothetical protein